MADCNPVSRRFESGLDFFTPVKLSQAEHAIRNREVAGSIPATGFVNAWDREAGR